MSNYCITHGVYELGFTGNCLLVACPPPDEPSLGDMDLEDDFSRVSPEELEIMNQSAIELELSL